MPRPLHGTVGVVDDVGQQYAPANPEKHEQAPVDAQMPRLPHTGDEDVIAKSPGTPNRGQQCSAGLAVSPHQG